MTQINIYTKKIRYRKLLKRTNEYFEKEYKWYKPLTVFTSSSGKYLVSIKKGNVRICYWDEDTQEGRETIEFLKKYVKDNFSNLTLGVKSSNCDDFFSEMETIKIIPINI